MKTIAKAEWITKTGIKHEAKLEDTSNTCKNGLNIEAYTVTHSWGEMEDGSICVSDHDYVAREYDSLDKAMSAYNSATELY